MKANLEARVQARPHAKSKNRIFLKNKYFIVLHSLHGIQRVCTFFTTFAPEMRECNLSDEK